MIPCQVSVSAEICICHAKICEKVLRYKTTLQNSFINQRLIPLTISDNWQSKNSDEVADDSPTKLNNKVGWPLTSTSFPGLFSAEERKGPSSPRRRKALGTRLMSAVTLLYYSTSSASRRLLHRNSCFVSCQRWWAVLIVDLWSCFVRLSCNAVLFRKF